jgi:hypothetical protein
MQRVAARRTNGEWPRVRRISEWEPRRYTATNGRPSFDPRNLLLPFGPSPLSIPNTALHCMVSRRFAWVADVFCGSRGPEAMVASIKHGKLPYSPRVGPIGWRFAAAHECIFAVRQMLGTWPGALGRRLGRSILSSHARPHQHTHFPLQIQCVTRLQQMMSLAASLPPWPILFVV